MPGPLSFPPPRGPRQWREALARRGARRIGAGTAAQEDIESVAGQLATLTQTVEEMARQLASLRRRADTQQEQADIQKERIDLAARELAEVSARLQAAANALRQSI